MTQYLRVFEQLAYLDRSIVFWQFGAFDYLLLFGVNTEKSGLGLVKNYKSARALAFKRFDESAETFLRAL